MAKRTLSAEHAAKMVAGRQQAREEREAALVAVQNPHFRKVAFWKSVEYELASAIGAAIEASAAAQKAARIKELEAELVRLKGE